VKATSLSPFRTAPGTPQTGADGRVAAGAAGAGPSRRAISASCPRRPRPCVHVWQNDTLAAVNDGVPPKNSNDQGSRDIRGGHRGTEEWIAYRFASRARWTAVRSTGSTTPAVGQCRTPAEWRLLWARRRRVEAGQADGRFVYGTTLDQFNKVGFEPVTTRELKIEVKLRKGFLGRVLKWMVWGRNNHTAAASPRGKCNG